MNRQCDACGKPYDAARPSSKFCSPACRQRNARGSNLVHLPPANPVAAEPSGTVAAVTAELEAANRLETHLGQAALKLAERVDTATAVMGFAALVKELRATMVEALKDVRDGSDALDVIRQSAALKLVQAG